MSSALMERFKSTLATTAAIALGLVAVAHYRHGGVEDPVSASRSPSIAITSSATGAWKDPPAAWIADVSAPAVGDAVAGVVMPGAVAPIIPVRLMPARQPRSVEATKRHEAAKRSPRIHQASAEDGGRSGEGLAMPSKDRHAVDENGRDPIGVLIRELDAGARHGS